MRRWAAFVLGLLLATSAAAQTSTSSTATSQGGGGSSGGSSGGGGGGSSLTSSDGSIVILGDDLTVDDSVFERYLTGTGAAPGTCTPGTNYIRTDTDEFFPCTSTNTFVQAVTHQQTSIAGASWFIDEDSFATNSATRVPSQQSVKAYVDANAGGGSSITAIHVTDDFAAGSTLVAADSGKAGVGSLNWKTSFTNGSSATGTASADHPGLYTLSSNTTDNDRATISAFSQTSGDYASANDFEMVFVFRLPAAITSTYLRLGLGESATLTQTGAIGYIYDTDATHTNGIFQICDSSTTGCQAAADDTNSDTVASTTTLTANTWHAFRLRYDATGVGGNPTYYMSLGIAGAYETEKTFCSSGCDSTMANLPTGTLVILWTVASRAAATTKTLDIDFFSYDITGLSRF